MERERRNFNLIFLSIEEKKLEEERRKEWEGIFGKLKRNIGIKILNLTRVTLDIISVTYMIWKLYA